MAEVSAARLLAEMIASKRFKTVKQLVAHAGSAPGERSSGTSVRGKASLGKAGRSRLRKALDMCAVVASTPDPALRAFAQRMRQRSKPAKVVLTAVMRQLLHLLSGLLQSQEAYEPTKAFPGAALDWVPERAA